MKKLTILQSQNTHKKTRMKLTNFATSVLVILLLSISFSSIAQQSQKVVSVALPVSDWDKVLTALGEMKAKDAIGIIQSIHAQAEKQLAHNPVPPNPTKKKEESPIVPADHTKNR